MSMKGDLGLRKKVVTICTISIALLFISSATAVPQAHGSIIVEKIKEVDILKSIYTKLSEGTNKILEDTGEGNGLLLQVITSLIDIFKAISKGAIGLIEGILRLIGSLISIIVLMYENILFAPNPAYPILFNPINR